MGYSGRRKSEYLKYLQKGGNKYSARKCYLDGMLFDSQAEKERYCHLRLLEKAGEIHDLEHHPKFTLIPEQRDAYGKLLEKPVEYEADFMYLDDEGVVHVEDVKGMQDPPKEYVIKRKLMLYKHGIKIHEMYYRRGNWIEKERGKKIPEVMTW